MARDYENDSPIWVENLGGNVWMVVLRVGGIQIGTPCFWAASKENAEKEGMPLLLEELDQVTDELHQVRNYIENSCKKEE